MTIANHDLRRRTLTGLFWQFLGVGGQRVVQLAGPIVLSRVLLREDIGLFGIVLAGIGAIEALTKFMGEETTIWSQRSDDRSYLDTVFTVHVVRGLAISMLLCALSPLLAAFFAKPEIEARYWLPGLFLTLAPNGLIDGLSSPARALKLKGLAFRQIALGEFAATLCGTTLTIVLAFVFHDVYALLLGQLATTALRTAISYVVAPHRPRLCFDRQVAHELFHYGRGAAGVPFVLLMIFTAPAFVLGRVINDVAVAVYDYAGRLAKLPEDLFLRVLAPIAIPAYAQLQDDLPRLGRAWLGAVRAYLLVGVPMTVSLAWCGNALPAVAFTANYATVAGLATLLAVHGGIAGLTAVVGPLFWAIGRPHLDRNAQLLRLVVTYGLGIPAAMHGGILSFAGAMCCAIGTCLVVSIAYALRHLQLTVGALFEFAREGLGVGLLMLAALWGCDRLFAPDGWLRVVVAGAVGGPVVAVLALRMLRQQRRAPPAASAPGELPQPDDREPVVSEAGH